MDDASKVDLSNLSDQSIGEILVSVGRLSPEDAEHIYQEQRKRKLRFGDAALELGLVTEADIQFALSHQFRYPYLQRGESKVSETVIAAYDPFAPQVEALRALRSQLMLRWFDVNAKHKTLAIMSPDFGEGRSWLTANLAVVFSQLGSRTLLIDANLRTPALHRLFGIDHRRGGLSSILGGRATGNIVFKIPLLLDLSVLPAGPIPPNPQELLARPLFNRMLEQLANSFDVILIDTPAASQFAESVTIASRVGGALIVSRQNQTRIRALNELYTCLNDSNVIIAGSVLNCGGTNKKKNNKRNNLKLPLNNLNLRLKNSTPPLLDKTESSIQTSSPTNMPPQSYRKKRTAPPSMTLLGPEPPVETASPSTFTKDE